MSNDIEPRHELAILKSIDASMDILRPSAAGQELTPWQEGWNAYGLTVRDRRFSAKKWFRALSSDDREIIGDLLASGHLHLVPADDGLRLHTSCDDLFEWRSSDSEEVSLAEVPALAAAIEDDPKWGAWIWASKKRGVPPQESVADDMKDDGVWDAELDALEQGQHTATQSKAPR